MDTRSVARAARTEVGTFNAWIQRGLLPGIELGVSGVRRDIDPKTATLALIFAELLRVGMAAKEAALVAATLPDEATAGGWLFVPTWETKAPHSIQHLRECDDVPKSLAAVTSFYGMVNIGLLAERVREAEAEWRARRQPSKAP